MRNAIVGATSIARTFATGPCLRMPGPAAMNVAVHVHVVLEVDEVRQVAVLAEELRERDPLPRRRRVDWYGGRNTTTTSPERFGCSASVPSTLRSSSFFMILRTTCLPGFAGSVRFLKR